MNKNYKQNLKERNKDHKVFDDSKKKLDIKEYLIKKNTPLLEYLITDLKFSRNNAKALLAHHLISVDGAPISQFDFMLVKGDTLIISKRPIRKKSRKDLPIIYEDSEIIVINKPHGLLSIASDKEKSRTAYRMVMDYLQAKDKKARVFVVHRLDKETSGILLFAKSEALKLELQEKWNEIVEKRGYYAVCEGVFEKKSDRVENYLKMNKENLMYVTNIRRGSFKAITEYKVIKENDKYSLLEVLLFTGRKNQIRVTLGDLGHYVLGDDKYGEPSNPLSRLCLHAYELKFTNPLTNKKYVFKCDMPEDFKKIVK